MEQRRKPPQRMDPTFLPQFYPMGRPLLYVSPGAQGSVYGAIDTVRLTCATAYKTGGTVSGLGPGSKVRLVNNQNFNDVITLTANGA